MPRAVVLAVAALAVVTRCAPASTPLDERNGSTAELLLLAVDGGGAGGDAAASAPGRKVVPKSIFIAPGFDQPCPQGYKRNATGHCVPTHVLNESGQLAFLFAKLLQNSGGGGGPGGSPGPGGTPGGFQGGGFPEVVNAATPGPASISIPMPSGGGLDAGVFGGFPGGDGEGGKVAKDERDANESATAEDSEAEEEEDSTATTTTMSTLTDSTTEPPGATSTATDPTPTASEWFTTDSPSPTRNGGELTYEATTFGSGADEGGAPETEPVAFRVPLDFGDEDLDSESLSPSAVVFTHRNRDKNSWRFGPPWRDLVIGRSPSDDLYRRLLHEQLAYLLRKNR